MNVLVVNLGSTTIKFDVYEMASERLVPRELHGVAIINPGGEPQVELARTDAIHLGVDPPLRESGHLGFRLRGPRGEIAIARGVIIAQRHIHAPAAEAERLGIADRDVVRIRIDGPGEITLGDVVVRADFALDLHLDTDEANAAGIRDRTVAVLVGIEHRATS